MNIAKNIKLLRKNLNMTQKQLAEKTGIAQITIQQYEAGKYEPKYDNLMKLAKALEVDITDIADDYCQIGVEGRRDLGPILSKASIRTEKIDEVILINYYRQLNNTGKTEAHKRVGELTLLDIYKTTETLQGVIMKYNPDCPYDISPLNAFYNKLKQQEKDMPNDGFEPPQE